MIDNRSRKRSSWSRWSVFGALSLVLVLTYQNCGSDFALKGNLDLASGSVTELGIACDLAAFKTTYQPFLAKCAACHKAGGVGKGGFSDSNDQVAFGAFELAEGLIDDRAVLPSHAPGITGPANQSTVDATRASFDAKMAACKGGTGPGPSTGGGAPALTTAKTVGAGATQTLTYNLQTELASGAQTAGATLSIVLQITTNTDGSLLYTFTQPRVTTTTRGVRVAELFINYNGNDLPLVTTFGRVDKTIAANQTNVNLSDTPTAAAAFAVPAPGGTPHRIAISLGWLVPQ